VFPGTHGTHFILVWVIVNCEVRINKGKDVKQKRDIDDSQVWTRQGGW